MTTIARSRIDTLVTTDWLSQHLDDPDLVVLDCSVRMKPNDDGSYQNVSGRTAYDEGHIPGAGFADLTADLVDTNSPFEFAVPTAEQFCAAMGALGVGNDSRVVLYDSVYSMWAARVWWMLRWVGFDHAAILDGGLSVWTAEGRPLSTAAVTLIINRLRQLLQRRHWQKQFFDFVIMNKLRQRLVGEKPKKHLTFS